MQALQPSLQKEPLLNDDNPTRLFESVSANFFTVTGKPLLITDRLSGWPMVVPCRGDITSITTIRYFCRYFREVCVPLCLWPDRGPQITKHEPQQFTDKCGIRYHHVATLSLVTKTAVKSIKTMRTLAEPYWNYATLLDVTWTPTQNLLPLSLSPRGG